MHASETKIFSYHHDYEFTFVNYCIQYSYKLLVISNIEWYSTAISDCVKFCVHCPLPRCPPYLLRNWREPIKNFIHGNTSINYDFAHQERIGEDVWVPALVKSLIQLLFIEPLLFLVDALVARILLYSRPRADSLTHICGTRGRWINHFESIGRYNKPSNARKQKYIFNCST